MELDMLCVSLVLHQTYLWDVDVSIGPDLPPMVTSSGRGGVTGYTWIRTSHIRSDLSTVTENPNAILYKVTYQLNRFGNRDAFPKVSVV